MTDKPRSATQLLRWRRKQNSREPFDAEAWLDQHYTARVDAVEAGDVDDHLGKIRHVETSQTVLDAIDDRLEREG